MLKNDVLGKKVIFYLLVAIIVSVIFNLVLLIINDGLFLEKLQIEAVNQQLSKTNLSEFLKRNSEPITLVVEWPWYSLLFYYGTYIFYWVILGKVSWKVLGERKGKISLAVPILTSLLFMDLFFIFYFLATYNGNMWGKKVERKQGAEG